SDALPAGYEPAIEDLEREGFKVRIVSFPYEIRPLQDARAVLKLWRFFRANRYDVVHSHTSKAGILVRLAARLADSPVIVHTAYDFHFRQFRLGPKQAFFVWLERIAAWYTDVMLYSTETIREAAVRHRIGGAEHGVVVGGPIADLERFEASERDVATLRGDLGLSRAEPVVACVSRLVDYKGIDTLLRAACLVVREQPQVRFVIMGGGPLEERLRAMAGDLGLADRVVFTGFRRDERDVIRLLALADLFCLSSRREGFGVAFAEAMAMGCPVVGPAMAPVTGVVVDGETGLLVQPEDEGAYAAAMLRLLGDPALRARLGAAGKAHVRAQLDPRRMYAAVTAAYTGSRRVRAA